METKDYYYLFKILIIGDSGVGKSSILSRFAEDVYIDSYMSTIGLDFKIKTLFVGNKVVKLQIWDTAGQERFRTVTRSYYHNADSVLIVFDLTNRKSFENINKWIEDINNFCPENICYNIVGNKADIVSNIQVTKDEIENKYKCKYIETSAKDGNNIDILFDTIAKELYDNIKKDDLDKKLIQHVSDDNCRKKKKCCITM